MRVAATAAVLRQVFHDARNRAAISPPSPSLRAGNSGDFDCQISGGASPLDRNVVWCATSRRTAAWPLLARTVINGEFSPKTVSRAALIVTERFATRPPTPWINDHINQETDSGVIATASTTMLWSSATDTVTRPPKLSCGLNTRRVGLALSV